MWTQKNRQKLLVAVCPPLSGLLNPATGIPAAVSTYTAAAVFVNIIFILRLPWYGWLTISQKKANGGTAMTEEEKLIDLTEHHYYYRHDRMLAVQNDLFKTYLWSASLAITLDGLLMQHLPGPPLSVSRGISLASALIALAVIVVCLDGLRGRAKRNYPVFPAYLAQLKQYDRPKVMEQLIGDFWDCSMTEQAAQEKRTTKLRVSSIALIFSFILLALAVICFIPQILPH